MDRFDELVDRFQLEPGAAEAGRAAAKAAEDAAEARAVELTVIARRMGVELSMATARVRAAAELSEGKGQDGE